MHAAKDNPLRIRALRFQGETQRVADEISDILHFWDLIIMCQNNGMLLSSESFNLFSYRYHRLPPLQFSPRIGWHEIRPGGKNAPELPS